MYTPEIQIKKKAALISMLIGILMFIGKIGAYVLTNSAAILSDALESIVHIVAASLAFYSMMLSLRPPDKNQPYGYGKIEYFSAGFEGSLIIFAAISILYFAIKDIVEGPDVQKIDVGIYIIFAASAINLFLGFYLINTGKRTNSLILVADGKHVLTDSITSFGAIAALIVVLLTGNVYFDPIFAIIIAINILFTGLKLIRQSFNGLMNRSDPNVLKQLDTFFINIVSSDNRLIEFHRLRYWSSGDKVFVDLHLTCNDELTIIESHDLLTEIEAQISEEIFPGSKVELMLHFDPTGLSGHGIENISHESEAS
ncbi:MAG: cation diffusion facilitator family transporter [Ignavibacteriaceae bacterium]|nr:cation diffusion facilitator family transporter [Ignavibacteriaceae bacterium]